MKIFTQTGLIRKLRRGGTNERRVIGKIGMLKVEFIEATITLNSQVYVRNSAVLPELIIRLGCTFFR